ncbi:uncharacterized protein METZ01_LOCUS510689, partial [marine metagenome]
VPIGGRFVGPGQAQQPRLLIGPSDEHEPDRQPL